MKLYPTVLIPDLEDGLFTPVENVYLLTPDELKTIIGNSFDAGRDADAYSWAGVDFKYENKEDYLNNLKLD